MDADFDTIDRQIEAAAARPLPSEQEMHDADRAPEFSDDDLAARFSALHGASWRYVATWGKWLEWDGCVWRIEKTLKVWNLIRKVCRTASALEGDHKIARGIASTKTVRAVEALAQSDPRHAMTDDGWDSDPWLLNTPDGVVDLQTGNIRPHDPAFYMTKITAVGPSDAGCPTWLSFLDTACKQDAGLIEYLQRVFGYALAGVTTEHALFFCYGKGRNGKGTAINTVERIMASYACVAGMETFTASKHDRHLTELARLQGARLVTSQETEEGRAWAESRIKALTGGDPITANFMRKDHFTFLPIFKLIIAGNHKPAIKNLDEAMRARINLIPFLVTIPKAQRDPDLPAKLEAEWPAILQWMIEGCLAYQVKRLEQPQAVIDATAEYFSEQNLFAQWIEQCCILGGPTHIRTNDLFKSWQAFAQAQNEDAGSQKAFTGKLKDMDLKHKLTSKNQSGFVGIALRVDASEQDGRYGPD